VANPYVTTTSILDYYDERLLAQVLVDNNSTGMVNGVVVWDATRLARLQIILDDAASEVEAALRGAYRPPILLTGTATPAPQVCRLVAALAIDRAFSRRGDVPKWVVSARDWYAAQIKEYVSRRQAIPGVSFGSAPALVEAQKITTGGVMEKAIFSGLGNDGGWPRP
jgi:hypothetical protein